MKAEVIMGITKVTKNFVRYDAMMDQEGQHDKENLASENVYVRKAAFPGETLPELIRVTIEEA